MSKLGSILGGIGQGFADFGKSTVDMFGTGGASVLDLLTSGGRSTKHQDDFQKWLYKTDDLKDASAKGLGTTLNGISTVVDFIPGVNVITNSTLGNSAQGAIEGLADELKYKGKNADWGDAKKRMALGATTRFAGGKVGEAFGKSMKPVLNNAITKGIASGATSGAIGVGGDAMIEGQSLPQVLGAMAKGAGTGALVGGAGGISRMFTQPPVAKNAMSPEELQDKATAVMAEMLKTPMDSPQYKKLDELSRAYSAGFENVDDYNFYLAKRRMEAEKPTANKPTARRDNPEYGDINEMTVPEMKEELSKIWTPIYAPETSKLNRKNELRQHINALEGGYDSVDDYLAQSKAIRDSNAPRLTKTNITSASQVAPEIVRAYGGKENVQDLIDSDIDPLVLYHAVKGQKLGLALDTLDGKIVNPSLQAVNPSVNEGGDFGDVILLGDKRMAYRQDPSGKINTGDAPTIYDRDVFSPSMPTVHVTQDGKVRGFVGGEWTPDNVSDYMNKLGNQATESEATSPATFSALNAKRFNDLSELVDSRGKLMANEDAVSAFDKFNDDVLNQFAEINTKINQIDDEGLYPASTPEEGLEAIQYALAHPGEIEFMDEVLENPEVKQSVDKAIAMSKGVPSEYFEAKVSRPVDLSEFPGAILPEGYNNEQVLSALDKRKVPVLGYYNDEVEGKTLKDVLSRLAKSGNRFDTPYLLSLLGLLGGGALLANRDEDEEDNKEVYY